MIWTALINTWAQETIEEGWWATMEVDLARLVRRAYELGVREALVSQPQEVRERAEKALLPWIAAWEKSVASRVDPARGRGIKDN